MLRKGAAAIFAIGTLLVAASGAAASGLPLIEIPGAPEAPPLRLQTLEGETYDLADYRGRVVVVNFWATWCAPCRKELPALERAWRSLRPDGVAFLTVNLGAGPDLLRDFLNRNAIGLPVVTDAESSTFGPWQLQGLPTTYVVSPGGRIKFGAIGDRDWDSARILDPIRKLAR